jgi:hypothetical protein
MAQESPRILGSPCLQGVWGEFIIIIIIITQNLTGDLN